MSEKEELPSTSTAATSERVRSSGEWISSSRRSQSPSMSTVPPGDERPLTLTGGGTMGEPTTGDAIEYLKAANKRLKEKYDTSLDVMKDNVQEPYGMTYHQAQAVQANASMQPQSEYPSSSVVQSFPSGQPQIPTSAPDSSLLAHSSTSGITIIEHMSQQPLHVEKQVGDGYNWRKYGQKKVKGSEFPRSYYKCTYRGCPVRKKVERSLDGQVTEIVYKGGHNHRPPNQGKEGSTTNQSGSSIHDKRGSSELAASQFSSNKTKKIEHMYEASDSEVNSGETGEDEPEPKRRYTDKPPARESRVIVQTTSEVDLLDDGYRWRKYGQKVGRRNPHPRKYFKCTTQGCRARKFVQRAEKDPKVVVTTYEGIHNHDLPEAKSSSHDGVIAENSANFGSFPPMSSKNLQEADLSIGLPSSQNLSVDEVLTDTSDFFGPLRRRVTFSASKDYDVVIRYGRGDISNDDFISHLHLSLCRRGISVYEECNEVNAVPECRVLIILLTSTYVPRTSQTVLNTNIQRIEWFILSFTDYHHMILSVTARIMRVLFSKKNQKGGRML